jgi:hypothetical protein
MFSGSLFSQEKSVFISVHPWLKLLRSGYCRPAEDHDWLDKATPPNWQAKQRTEHLLLSLIYLICSLVKTVSFNAVKRQEARSRMADLRAARHSRKAAAAIQGRSSLFGDASKWRITNFKQAAYSVSRWA